MTVTATEPRGTLTTHDPARPGNGTSRTWTRVIRGKLYSFTAVIMPNGERRYFANRFDGTDSRFDCEWTHDVLSWTIPADRRPTEMFDLSFGAGEWETQFHSKSAAIEWARKKNLESFAVVDKNDTVVYEEFPEIKWV